MDLFLRCGHNFLIIEGDHSAGFIKLAVCDILDVMNRLQLSLEVTGMGQKRRGWRAIDHMRS